MPMLADQSHKDFPKMAIDCAHCKLIFAEMEQVYEIPAKNAGMGAQSGFKPVHEFLGKALRKAGWIKLIQSGFICPTCYEKLVEKSQEQLKSPVKNIFKELIDADIKGAQ